MRLGALYLLGLAALLVLLACPAAPPDLERALDLYREGRINEARRDMADYIRAKPYNPESEEARQHILLIRRIKKKESIAVEQWRGGNAREAAKIVGTMRFMHPVYVDSAELFRLIDFDRPPLWTSPIPKIPVPDHFEPADSTIQKLIPHAMAVLDQQVGVIIRLAREWEATRYRQTDKPVQLFATSISAPWFLERLEAVESASEQLREAGGPTNPLVLEVHRLSDKFDQFLSYPGSDTLQSTLAFEYGFQGHKRELLVQILALKARLASDRAPPAAADTTPQTGS